MIPAPDSCAVVFGRLGIDATKQVVAYDQGPGMYAARLWWMLDVLGHPVALLDGGLDRERCWVCGDGHEDMGGKIHVA